MTLESEIKALEEQKENLIKRVRKIKDEVIPILAEDLALFPERELRRRFLNNKRFAESLDENTIRAIKKEALEKGASTSKKVIALMQEEDRWLG